MKHVVAVMLSALVSSSAFAADPIGAAPAVVPAPTASSLVWFGEGSIALHGAMTSPPDTARVYVAPYVEIGGKFALQPEHSRFGAQLDLRYSGLDVRWISPNLKATGAAGDLRGVVHLSHLATDQLKLGLFAGLQEDYIVTRPRDSDSYRFGLTTWRVGLEGLYQASAKTTWFGHVAYLDPWQITDGDERRVDSGNALWGSQVGIGLDHRFAPTWKAGASIDFTNLRMRREGDLSIFDIGGKIEHDLSVVPGSLALDMSWRPVVAREFGGESIQLNTFGLGVRYTYRFGVPETSAGTTLLRY